MANEIEEYSADMDVWITIKLALPNEWSPTEVCTGIQVDEGKLIIFGGSDINVEDTSSCYEFDSETYSIKKIADLVIPHVFVNYPFFYGNQVFALGNEYYVKQWKIQRYDIEKNEWSVIY